VVFGLDRGPFSHILMPGLYAYWAGQKDVRVEVVDARQVRFEHAGLEGHRRSCNAVHALDVCTSSVTTWHLVQDGDYVQTLRRPVRVLEGAADARVVEVEHARGDGRRSAARRS